MSQDEGFASLIARIRSGDEKAAARLVARYEPELRRLVRLRLNDPYLRRLVDSGDICQSVMANFFIRAALGQFHLEQPEHLLRLLATMAKNKLLNLARDRRKEKQAHAQGANLLLDVADREDSPSHVVASKDLLRAARAKLTRQERTLAELRAGGHSWQHIAREVGSSPEAVRKQLARAVNRVSQSLGLGEGPHG